MEHSPLQSRVHRARQRRSDINVWLMTRSYKYVSFPQEDREAAIAEMTRELKDLPQGPVSASGVKLRVTTTWLR